MRLYAKIVTTVASVVSLFSLPFVCASPSKVDGASTIEAARSSTNTNLVVGAQISDNIRDSNPNGMTYSEGIYSYTRTGNWLHSRTLCVSPLLDKESVDIDGVETSTKTLDVYYSCELKQTDASNGNSFGLVIGRVSLSTGDDAYLCCCVRPKDGDVIFTYYKKNQVESDQFAKLGGSSITIPVGFTRKLEILRSGNELSVYVKGSLVNTVTSITDDATMSVDKTNLETISFANMIPACGVMFCDVTGTISNVTCKYLKTGSYAAHETHYQSLDDARASANEDVFSLDAVSASGNKRDTNANGFSFDGTTATMEYGGSWFRALNTFTNKYFDSNELNLSGGEVISTKGKGAYFKAKFSVSQMDQDRSLGIVFAKLNVLSETVYVSFNVCPKSNYVSLYFAKLKGATYDCSFIKNAALNIKVNTEHVLEVVYKDGIADCFCDGVRYFSLREYDVIPYLQEFSIHVDLSEAIPCFGTNFCDIGAAIYGFEMKYLEEYESIKVFVEPTYPNSVPSYSYNTEPGTYTKRPAGEDAGKGYGIPAIIGGISAIVAAITAFILINRKKEKRK